MRATDPWIRYSPIRSPSLYRGSSHTVDSVEDEEQQKQAEAKRQPIGFRPPQRDDAVAASEPS